MKARESRSARGCLGNLFNLLFHRNMLVDGHPLILNPKRISYGGFYHIEIEKLIYKRWERHSYIDCYIDIYGYRERIIMIAL